MKKTHLFITTLLIFAFTSCASKAKSEPISDSYEISETTVISDENIQQEKPIKQKKKLSDKKSYEKNGIEKFLTYGNKDKFIKYDETSIYSLTMFDSIKQQKATILVSTEEDQLAGFGSSIISNYYIVLMDPTVREKLTKAKNNYYSDFENKKLLKKNNNTYKQYGKYEATLNWGTLSNSTPNFATGNIYFGYEFVKNSPYFIISAFPMHNEYFDIVGDSVSKDSMRIKFFLTKSQLNDLVTTLSEDNINEVLTDYFDTKYFKSAETDIYEDEYIEE